MTAESFRSAMRVMRVLVCGGRDYAERGQVFVTLNGIATANGELHIIQGGAEGADGFAREWAQAEYATLTSYFANWQAHGRKAGPIRNQTMIDEGKPHLVVAFPGGRGTADMVRRAEASGIPVLKVPEPHEHACIVDPDEVSHATCHCACGATCQNTMGEPEWFTPEEAAVEGRSHQGEK